MIASSAKLSYLNGHSHDADVKLYLESLKAGEKPDHRPDCGQWIQVVESAEDSFNRAKHKGSMVQALLQSLIKSKKYPGLKELLSSSGMGNSRAGELDPHQAPALAEVGNYPALPDSAKLPPELATGACILNDIYCAYSEMVSPESFEEYHEDCFLWILSTIAARRIRIPLGLDNYTPLMLVMTSEPSVVKKTSAAKVAKKILYLAELDWLLGAGHTTPQKMVYDMAGTLPKNYDEMDKELQQRFEKRLAFSGQRGMYNDEFGKFVASIMRSSGPMADFQQLLLEMDNCEPVYENATISRNAERIENPYVALLGSMTYDSIKNAAKRGADFWGDGFWSRFSFTCAPKGTNKDCPFQEMDIPIPWDVVDALKAWHERLGVPVVAIEPILDEKNKDTGRYNKRIVEPLPENVCKLGEGVRDAWVRYRSALKSIFTQWNTTDLNASYDRLATRAMRVAALFASLENNNQIEMCHWAKAQEIAERWRKSLHELYSQVNSS